MQLTGVSCRSGGALADSGDRSGGRAGAVRSRPWPFFASVRLLVLGPAGLRALFAVVVAVVRLELGGAAAVQHHAQHVGPVARQQVGDPLGRAGAGLSRHAARRTTLSAAASRSVASLVVSIGGVSSRTMSNSLRQRSTERRSCGDDLGRAPVTLGAGNEPDVVETRSGRLVGIVEVGHRGEVPADARLAVVAVDDERAHAAVAEHRGDVGHRGRLALPGVRRGDHHHRVFGGASTDGPPAATDSPGRCWPSTNSSDVRTAR